MLKNLIGRNFKDSQKSAPSVAVKDISGVSHSVMFDDIMEIKVRKDAQLDFLAMMAADNDISCMFVDFTTKRDKFSADCDQNNFKNLLDTLAVVLPKDILLALAQAITSLILEPFDKTIIIYKKQ